ncbi:biotin carboxyl carrier protein of acetyl-CoA carboxylase [Clostridium homopropionicum DSM 5847]|uniref:Biotin carboxyl carrier protein of acetyl-CoA carboxylase n=1 Tax=Clostridium homopropionicum DSM 5847 TaxID=1121318 RepID=A0A0L6Z7V7_9CLOT|nr:acetyl-CoA carboxylase biotin carboxyl carrier protein [Clostridium homopropionicum]KOA19052.1 biotin carboxyl carrier protein of acetyl-CoA carboxylase [Clostridium homopropionicum DSM 5847]SFG91689.1 acetyl-CoA carboxylase biotin carboxyl carrier protein [Clostridium homopropionicum]
MDYKSIQELIKTVSDSNLTSFEIEAEGIRIKMGKVEKVQIESTNPVKNIDTAVNTNDVMKEVSFEKASVDTKVEVVDNVKTDGTALTIKSPIVGTFYASSSPKEEPFVKVGKRVNKGDTICIIEAMKLMNEIEAEDNFEILDILVENEQMVEYGQPLFKVAKL